VIHIPTPGERHLERKRRSDAMASNQAQFTLAAGDYSSQVLRVTGFAGYELISRPFRFTVQVSPQLDLDLAALLDQEALLTIQGRSAPRYIHGIIYEAQQVEHMCQLEIVPTLWKLGARRQSRIFQKKTTQEILELVLKGGGVDSERYKFALRGEYKTRDYCVQYRESDLDFLNRLMEEDGMFYFFKHEKEKHTLVIGDDPVAHVPIPLAPSLNYYPPTAMATSEQHISRFDFTQRIQPGSVMLRDYSPKKPAMPLDAKKSSDAFSDIEIYDYPGEYVDPDLGKTLARIRLEESQAQRKIGTGESDSPHMISGYTFALNRYPTAGTNNLNREYLVTSVHHSGTQPQSLGALAGGGGGHYLNSFTVIPSDVVFRQTRETVRPLITSIQTATVVGPSGQEIYTDEDARIKVQFHWDRDEDVKTEERSCWVRVSQPWAGSHYGVVFIPRVGHEVIVQFLEGDPDRPLVTGSVYNGQNPAPYGQKGANTFSTIKSNSSLGGGGYNELRFNDKKGSEEIYLQAQKSWTILVKGSKSEQVWGSETVSVGGKRSETVKKDTSLTVKEGVLSIKTEQQNIDVQAETEIKLTSGGSSATMKKDGTIAFKGDKEISLTSGAASITLKMDGTIEIKGVNITVDGSATIESKAGGTHTVKGAPVKINC